MLRVPIEELLLAGTYKDADVDWYPLRGKAGFLADPFGIERDGRLLVFCEYFAYRGSRGRIRTIEYVGGEFADGESDALSLRGHISYPCLIDLPEGLFCVVETAEMAEVALYRWSDDTRRLSKVAVLLDGFPGVDPTVFQSDGRWWLMCTRKGPQEDSELWVWHAPELIGPWTAHALNPVKTDKRGARPAGPPFVHDGSLYRPAQDCSQTYGGGVTIHRVTRLNENEFAEEQVCAIEAGAATRYPIGPHTVTPVGDLVLIDGRRTTFVPAALLAFLTIVLRALVGRVRRRR